MADRGATPERGSVSRDREILCILFDATNNAKEGDASDYTEKCLQDGWEFKDGWKSGMAMGEWHGVTTNAEGRVIRLELVGNDLKGIIPPQLGDLDALEQLNLGGNRLVGVIPPELGDLKALEALYLSQCGLQGSIPSELGKLQALKRLDLASNASLGGVIPPELGDLKALEVLGLHGCKLKGSIPSELGKLQALKRLDLYLNASLGGVIPPELGDLKALEYLNLSLCGLEGSIPSELGKLQALKLLGLSANASLGGVIPPELGDLKALEWLGLAGCKLEGSIPSWLGKLQALKRLFLGSNASLGGVIPPELGDLKALEYLNLSLCGLEGVIPPELGDLKALDTLDLSRCGLEGGIPSWLGKLQALKELHLSSNASLGGIIPPELGGLKSLKRLDLSQCGLEGCVAPQLGNLQAAEFINLSGNNLTGLWDHTQDASLGQGARETPGRCIPSQLRRLLELLREVEARRGLRLRGNPWAEPPEATVKSGIAAVFAYFDALYSSPCKVRRNSVKVVLVGQEGAGKTSLRQSMKTGQATPTNGSIESTVFADVETIEVNGASVRVYDCAGQVAYTGMLQMFLTPRAICLVVCDAGAFGQPDSGVDDQLEKDIPTLESLRVCDWMRSISQRVPQNDVVLVATKCDLAGENIAGIGQRMHSACRTWIAKWVEAGMEPIRLENGVCLTSCCESASNEQEAKSLKRKRGVSWECDWRDDMAEEPPLSMLHRIVHKSDGRGRRGAEMVLPHSWDIALTVLEALDNGRDPVEAVVHRSPEPHLEVARKTEQFKGITVEDLKVRWKAVVVGLSSNGINITNPDHALEGALSIREFEGTVVRHETFVFLDVIWLSRILKPLLNHKDTQSFDGTVFLGDTGDTRIILDDEHHIGSWNMFKEEGVLKPELACELWPDLFQYVLPTLTSLGLAFPLNADSAEDLVVLLRLGTVRPCSVSKDIKTFCMEHSAVFDVGWSFFLGVPPGEIEKVLSRCCSIGTVQTFWRFGVLVQGSLSGSEGSGSFALVLEYSCGNNQLDLKVYGDVCTVAPWAALSYAISAVRAMGAGFPGLRSRASMKCPENGHDTGMTITTRGAGEKLLQGRGCSRCSLETGGIGAAAFEIVRMVEVGEARGVFCKVNARFVGVQHKYTALRPAGSRDLHSEMLSLQLKAAEESLLKRIQEYLENVLPSAGGPAAVGFREEDKPCPDWKNLQRAVEEIIEGRMSGLEATMGGVAAKMSEIAAAMMTADDGVTKTLDVVVAMLMAVRGDAFDTPRQACVLPGDYAPHGLTAELSSPKVWTQRLQEWIASDFKAGKGVWKKKMRLFLVCAHTHELVPCGHDGRGYDVQRFRRWVGVAVDVAKFALQVTCTLLAGPLVAQLPVLSLGAVGEETAKAAFSKMVERLEGLALHDNDDGAAGVPREEVKTLKGNAYKSLRTFVHEMEDTARLRNSAARKKAHRKSKVHPSKPDFVSFEDVMTKVQARTGDGEGQWVLLAHEQAWLDAAT